MSTMPPPVDLVEAEQDFVVVIAEGMVGVDGAHMKTAVADDAVAAGIGAGPIAVALTRVTVGNTEWLLTKSTPSWRSRHRFGVSSAVMASGRSPSSTSTMLSVARPGARRERPRRRRRVRM